MDHLHHLHDLFRRFPGIGPRQAKRFVYFLLTVPESYKKELVDEIGKLESRVTTCPTCYRFFDKKGSQKECMICRDGSRNRESLMIVTKDVDLEAIEKSRVYDGYYFVLGGSIPLFDKTAHTKIRLKELVSRIERGAERGLKEIILALSLNAEGEHTRESIETTISPLVKKLGVSIYTLGRGLSTGTELEYSDSETIKNALISKKREGV